MSSEMKSMAMAQAAQKSVALVWILNFVVMGTGNLYAGAWISGVIGLLSFVCAFAIMVLTVGIGGIVVAPVMLVLWIILSIVGQNVLKRKNVRAVESAFQG
jgi:hypothetical protein